MMQIDRRLLAALASAFLGCATPPALAPPPPRRTSTIAVWRELDALWVRRHAGKIVFGTTRFRTTVAANPDERVRVGVLEEYAGATGTQWRTSAWIAGFLAADLLGRDLAQYRFNVSVGGFVDGTSAGALMAAGFLAAMTGDAVRSDTTLTGSLGADGSVAPVGGVPEKVRAAARIGKRRVGIPAGQAVAQDLEGTAVDVRALGRTLGVEVHEVGDLYETYALLTGKRLPRPRAIAEDELALGPLQGARLRTSLPRLLERVDADLRLARRDLPEPVAAVVAAATKARLEAEAYLAAGDVAAARQRTLTAASKAKAVVRVLSLVEADPRLREAAEPEADFRSALRRFERELEAQAARPDADQLTLVAAYGGVPRARGYLEVAEMLLPEALSDSAPLSAAESARFLPTALYLGLAELALEAARETMATPSGGPRFALDRRALSRIASSFASAAIANVSYVDAQLLTELAAGQGLPVELVRGLFSLHEPAYLLALKLAEKLIAGQAEPAPPDPLLRLASAVTAYVESAGVLAKYQAFGAPAPGTPRTHPLGRGAGLAAVLRRARLAAREAASVARGRLGVVPPEARLYYRAAVALEDGDAVEQLRALTAYWRATFASRIAAQVLRR